MYYIYWLVWFGLILINLNNTITHEYIHITIMYYIYNNKFGICNMLLLYNIYYIYPIYTGVELPDWAFRTRSVLAVYSREVAFLSLSLSLSIKRNKISLYIYIIDIYI